MAEGNGMVPVSWLQVGCVNLHRVWFSLYLLPYTFHSHHSSCQFVKWCHGLWPQPFLYQALLLPCYCNKTRYKPHWWTGIWADKRTWGNGRKKTCFNRLLLLTSNCQKFGKTHKHQWGLKVVSVRNSFPIACLCVLDLWCSGFSSCHSLLS